MSRSPGIPRRGPPKNPNNKPPVKVQKVVCCAWFYELAAPGSLSMLTEVNRSYVVKLKLSHPCSLFQIFWPHGHSPGLQTNGRLSCPGQLLVPADVIPTTLAGCSSPRITQEQSISIIWYASQNHLSQHHRFPYPPAIYGIMLLYMM